MDAFSWNMFFRGKTQFDLTLNANTAETSVMAFHFPLKIFLMNCGHEMEEELFLEPITLH